MTQDDLRKLMTSMTICSAELEMGARVLHMSDEGDMADTLDAIAQKIREERDRFCHDKTYR